MSLLKGGHRTRDPRLDRIPSFDDRSRAYQVRRLLARKPPRVSRGWSPGVTLDQGRDGACTGFAAAHRLGSSPVRHGVSNEFAFDVYRKARTLDEWPGENYDGSSVLGAMKALAAMQKIAEYRWTGAGSGSPVEDVVDTLGHVGPIVFGWDWPASFMQPRPSGLLELDKATFDGSGHAILSLAILLRWRHPLEGAKPIEVVCLQQSWGVWGVGRYRQPAGFCFVRLADVETLLERQGEGAVPLETRSMRSTEGR